MVQRVQFHLTYPFGSLKLNRTATGLPNVFFSLSEDQCDTAVHICGSVVEEVSWLNSGAVQDFSLCNLFYDPQASVGFLLGFSLSSKKTKQHV